MAGFDELMDGAFDDLAKRFGLGREQVEAAAKALMPAFAEAMRRGMADPAAAAELMQAWQRHALAGFKPGGADAAGAMFGNEALRGAVAEQAAKASGLSGEMMRALLPPLAATFLGNAATAFARGLKPPPTPPETMADAAAAFADFMKGMGSAPAGGSATAAPGTKPDAPASDPMALGRALAEQQSRAMQALFDTFGPKKPS
ncbi:MAG TPA: DUF937 domain-containing protein [Hyphomicrobiales bacterium]|nr:DUF937 domain-containing protein [Hyphomicrobiales bacterium]